MIDSDDRVIADTQRWIKNIVIAHNFCPFAKKPFTEDRIRYFVSSASEEKALVDDVINEMILLRDAESKNIETSLILIPNCLNKFDEYNQFLTLAEMILEKLSLDGIIQLATFHPEYCFEGLSIDDVQNYTNRSIYPMLHLIREDSIEEVRSFYPDIDDIPEKNMKKLLSIGLNRIGKQRAACQLGKK